MFRSRYVNNQRGLPVASWYSNCLRTLKNTIENFSCCRWWLPSWTGIQRRCQILGWRLMNLIASHFTGHFIIHSKAYLGEQQENHQNYTLLTLIGRLKNINKYFHNTSWGIPYISVETCFWVIISGSRKISLNLYSEQNNKKKSNFKIQLNNKITLRTLQRISCHFNK